MWLCLADVAAKVSIAFKDAVWFTAISLNKFKVPQQCCKWCRMAERLTLLAGTTRQALELDLFSGASASLSLSAQNKCCCFRVFCCWKVRTHRPGTQCCAMQSPAA